MSVRTQEPHGRTGYLELSFSRKTRNKCAVVSARGMRGKYTGIGGFLGILKRRSDESNCPHISSKPRTSTQVRDCPGLSGTTRDSLKRANEEVLRKTLGVLCLSPPVTTCVRAVLRKNEFEASYFFFVFILDLVVFEPCRAVQPL